LAQATGGWARPSSGPCMLGDSASARRATTVTTASVATDKQPLLKGLVGPGAMGDWEDEGTEHYESDVPNGVPKYLWDTKDVQKLEMVRCEAYVRVSAIDPKAGHFRVRMKCIWSFRTLNSKEDAELHLRGVPGIRMPGLVEVIEESRIWKDLSFSGDGQTTAKTVFWRGISLFTMDGFKCFEMHQFPFDRHVLNLERLEFVWRPDKDAADYYKSMKICSFKVHASSMLPDWNVHNHLALIRPINATEPDSNSRDQAELAPTYASKFTVKLRIERKHEFYAWQVFLVTYLITILTCCPLGMKADDVGDRLAVYVGGTLTLVAFKYGVSDHLPSVPYQTFTDKYLLWQVITVFSCGVLSILSFRITHEDFFGNNTEETRDTLRSTVDDIENVLGIFLLLGWTLRLLFTVFIKPHEGVPCGFGRDTWKMIMDTERKNQDEFGKEDEKRQEALENLRKTEMSKQASQCEDEADLQRHLNLTEDQVAKLVELRKQGLSLQPSTPTKS